MSFEVLIDLNVIVEHAIVVAVSVKESVGVYRGKILELNEAVGAEAGHHRVHELVHKLLMHFARDTILSQTNVERVLKQTLVIGSNVEHDRQALIRVNACQSRVQRKLANWNTYISYKIIIFFACLYYQSVKMSRQIPIP